MEDRKGRAWVATSASCMYEHTYGDMSGVTVWYCRYIEWFTRWIHDFSYNIYSSVFINFNFVFEVYAGGIQNDERCGRLKKCKRADVLEFHPYESFDSVTFENDIALLLLGTFMPDSSVPDEHYITRIPLHPRNKPIPGTKYKWDNVCYFVLFIFSQLNVFNFKSIVFFSGHPSTCSWFWKDETDYIQYKQ